MGLNDQDVQDDMVAHVDLIGRTGAKQLQVGYLDETEHFADARWYATVVYRGAKLMVENHRGPHLALEALAMRLLDGATCRYCGQSVTMTNHLRLGPTCRWALRGDRWVRGCEGTRDEPALPLEPFMRGGEQ